MAIESIGLELVRASLYGPIAFVVSEANLKQDDAPQPELPPIAQPSQFWARAVLVAAGVGFLGLLLVARVLSPDASGMGTHEQLGLPECGFKLAFDIPCPSCGMTTSWAWLTRGNLVESVRANPGGTMLGLECLGFGVWMLVSGIRGRWFLGIPTTFGLALLLGTTVLVTLLQWVRLVWLV